MDQRPKLKLISFVLANITLYLSPDISKVTLSISYCFPYNRKTLSQHRRYQGLRLQTNVNLVMELSVQWVVPAYSSLGRLCGARVQCFLKFNERKLESMGCVWNIHFNVQYFVLNDTQKVALLKFYSCYLKDETVTPLYRPQRGVRYMLATQTLRVQTPGWCE